MSKRQPYPKFEGPKAEQFWLSLRADSPELQEELEREFPDGASEPPEGVSRRDFFRVMGASFALAGVAACRRPDERIVPYAHQPEEVIPGNPLWYATAMPWNGSSIGLLVESHEGRPTKIEGNPRHPESLGGTNTWAQAEVLAMWDPDRSGTPLVGGKPAAWDTAVSGLRALGAQHKAQGGKGLAILTEAHRSPTTARLLAKLKADLPEAQIFRYDAFSRDGSRTGTQLAFGKVLEPVLHPGAAKVIVALDSDFLHNEAGGVRHTRELAQGRNRLSDMVRLYAVESSFTVTGAMADHRLARPSSVVTQVAVGLAAALGVGRGTASGLDGGAQTFLAAVAKDLKAAEGRALVVAGEKQPPEVHALVAALNVKLGGVGKTVTYVEPFDAAPEGPAAILALAKAIRDKQVTSLVILGGNPVHTAPADAKFAELLAKVQTSVHLSTHVDDTSAKATWHLPRAHVLEQWSDVRALDGTTSIVQPLIAPLFDGRTDAEVLALLAGEPARAHDLVRATHGLGDADWRKALHEGVIAGTAYPTATPTPATDLSGPKPAAAGLEVTFVPDEHAWDGRFANNAWTQESPDPMTKLTWSNAALVSYDDARELGLAVPEDSSKSDADLISLTTPDGGQVTLPALAAVGQPRGTITVAVGQGRKTVGRVGTDAGTSVAALRTSAAPWVVAGVKVAKAGGSEKLARTQEHFQMENRHPVRAATLATFRKEPRFVEKLEEPHPKLLSLFPDYDYSKTDEQGRYRHRWALAIDLNACTGCGACTVACQAENNIPVVGKDGVFRTREMHWIRVDRYFRGPDPTEVAESVAQPMPCQQCENAPCEQVCPVGATTHSPEGLNDMAYNRCIGTRYCLNNCPFKVRRFNFLNYTVRSAECVDGQIPELRRGQFNPDVTIRSRGVMEKCTYCVQRINAAKIDAHKAGKDAVADGAVKTACQQVCPAAAITFGDLNDPKSQVSALKADPRSYTLLDELNVRARTMYLARIRNENPELS
jgi:molybdopterin-containing oxidoreductase family iron-sulfur binding subunit